jgi:hypothetical protein
VHPLSSEVCIEIKHSSLTCAWEQLSKLFNHISNYTHAQLVALQYAHGEEKIIKHRDAYSLGMNFVLANKAIN